MASFDEIRKVRLEKMNLLLSKGINPYPAKTARVISLKEVVENFTELSQKKSKDLILAGRVMAIRGQGALIFFNINDGTAIFQGLLKKDEMEAEVFDLFANTVDMGDFVEITGSLFVTKKGQQTLQVKDWKMLTKSLSPLPDKWDGLQDEEERLRKRYLDIIFNPEVKEMVLFQTDFISLLKFFNEITLVNLVK